MKLRMMLRASVISALFMFYVAVNMSLAQQSPDVDQLLQIGLPQNALTLQVPMGQVNLSDGNLHLEIPLKSIPQRGNASPITIKWVYDSIFWKVMYNSCVPGSYCESWWEPTSYPVSGGWRLVVSPTLNDIMADETWVTDENCPNPSGDSTVPSWSNFTFTDSSGTSHLFPGGPITQNGSCYAPWPPYTYGWYSTDGSGYYMALTTDSYGGMGDGTIQVWDTSGTLLYNGGLYTGGSYEDSNGNIPESVLNSNFASTMTSGITVSNSLYYVNTNLASVNGAFQYTSELSSPSSITFPDGSKYTFHYDQCPNNSPCGSGDYHYGELTQMTLPTGVTITFAYQNVEPTVGLDVADLRVTSVSYSGESLGNCASSGSWSGQTWSLCYHVPSAYNTTEVDVTSPPDQQGTKNEIVYSGGSWNQYGDMAHPFFPLTRSIYQGLVQGGTLWQQDTYTYNGPLFRQLTGTTTQVAGQGQVSTTYGYWSDGLPMIATKKEYSQGGALMRETDQTYTSNFGPTVWGGAYRGPSFPHFIDRPLSASIYGQGGSSGTLLAQAIYSYDTTSLSSLSSPSGLSAHSVAGLSTHDDTNFGASQSSRGNLTAVSMMTSPGNSITTKTNYYNILGEVIQTTDGRGYNTLFDYYSPSWGVDNSCASYATYNYRYLVQDALGHQTRTTYNSCIGNVYSVQNQNDLNASRSGTVLTYDANDRLTHVAYPDGGWKTITFNYTNLPASEGTMVALTSTSSMSSTKIFDGLGRTVHEVDPAGYTVDTTYTALSQVASVSNPHGSAGASTDGITSYTYDPLGRKVKTARQDGAVAWSCFSGVQYSGAAQPNCVSSASGNGQVESWVDITDEDGHHSQHADDALGRLTSVMEPSPTSGALSLETDYGYDALNNLVSVTQWGGPYGSTGARTRSFSGSWQETGKVCVLRGFLNLGPSRGIGWFGH